MASLSTIWIWLCISWDPSTSRFLPVHLRYPALVPSLFMILSPSTSGVYSLTFPRIFPLPTFHRSSSPSSAVFASLISSMTLAQPRCSPSRAHQRHSRNRATTCLSTRKRLPPSCCSSELFPTGVFAISLVLLLGAFPHRGFCYFAYASSCVCCQFVPFRIPAVASLILLCWRILF